MSSPYLTSIRFNYLQYFFLSIYFYFTAPLANQENLLISLLWFTLGMAGASTAQSDSSKSQRKFLQYTMFLPFTLLYFIITGTSTILSELSFYVAIIVSILNIVVSVNVVYIKNKKD